jgi:dipeptidyl-peptidase-4
MNSWIGGAVTFVLMSTSTMLQAQGTKADYERFDKIGGITGGKVFRTKVQAHWLTGTKCFWYRNDLGHGRKDFVFVDAAVGKRKAAFDHERLAKDLAKATGKAFEAHKLPFDAIEYKKADGDEKGLLGEAVYFKAAGKSWKINLKDQSLTEDKPGAGKKVTALRGILAPRQEASKLLFSQSPQPGAVATLLHEKPAEPELQFPQSPEEKKAAAQKEEAKKVEAFIKDHNVWLRLGKDGEEVALTTDGKEGDAYQGNFQWSPDRRKLIGFRHKKAQEHIVYFVESSPKDQLQPKLHSNSYLKPGDQIAQTKPHLFDIVGKKEVPLDETLFANPWSIGSHRWEKDSSRFTFYYNQRGHGAVRIVAIDAGSGGVTALIDDTSKTFVNYSNYNHRQLLEPTNEMIWMSERDGWNHLYLYDFGSGQLKTQITKGPWIVRKVDRVDTAKRQIWFQAGGIYPEQDPYYIHYCRINFDGTGLVKLTAGDGTHSIEYSPDREFIVDTYSRVDMPPVNELRRVSDGSLVCSLENSDASELEATVWQRPERFVAKGRDGKTDIYGVIFRPSTFDPNKKYPVIEKIYAGPHGSFVPKFFSPCHGAQRWAELGFIVVQIDGMGTSHRSKAFHDVCWKNVGDGGFPDRILWIKEAAKKYPYMNLSRVGIFGGSAGGQSSTGALLKHGDFYKVAVSDCGCHDNRMDKIWWNEAWMGWPVGPEYAESSNVTHAHKLQGKLLLIVGELDRNVDPASTMQVVDALVKADRDFDMLIIPGAGHGAAGSAYGKRRQKDYFVRNLLGVEPRWEP